MGLGNAPGDGQPDAKAAGGSIAGGVGAVKAVKQLCKRFLRDGVAAVAAAQRNAPPGLFQRQGDGAVCPGVLDRVVQQNAHQLPDGVFIALIGQVRGDIQYKAVPLALGKVPEGLGGVRYCFADGERLHLQRGDPLVHAGQGDQCIDQRRQLFGLRLRFIDPFLLAGLHFQHAQTGGNDRDGGLELVAGVGDKLLLLFSAAHHRIDGAAGEQHHQHKHQQNAGGIRSKAPQQHQPHRAQLLVAIQKYRHVAPLAGAGDVVPVAAVAAVARAMRHGSGQIRHDVLLGDRGDILKVCLHQRAVILIPQHKVSGGVGGLGGKASVPRGLRCLGRGGGYLPGRAVGGDHALIAADELQHIPQLPGGGNVIRGVQQQSQQQHHRRDR